MDDRDQPFALTLEKIDDAFGRGSSERLCDVNICLDWAWRRLPPAPGKGFETEEEAVAVASVLERAQNKFGSVVLPDEGEKVVFWKSVDSWESNGGSHYHMEGEWSVTYTRKIRPNAFPEYLKEVKRDGVTFVWTPETSWVEDSSGCIERFFRT